MKMRYVVLTILIILTSGQMLHAENAGEDTIQLEEIVVIGEKLVTPTKQTAETVYTGSEITPKGLDALGTEASVSIYEAVKILPGVSVDSVGPYGLAAEQKSIRIRGVRGSLGALTVAGVPNYGGNPMGPREYIYDTENLESIAVYKGAVPADLGTGVGARGGAIELRPRWPAKRRGVSFYQGVGADNYTRTHARLDSGVLPVTGTALSGSYSYTEADKWKGPGDLGPRHNLNVMLRQPVAERDQFNFMFNYNDYEQHLYRPLSYADVQHPNANYDKDYNAVLTGTAGEDINYYQYNRGAYNNQDYLAVIPLTLTDRLRLTFKPYVALEDAEIFQGSGARGGIVQKRSRDIERCGIISSIDTSFAWATAFLGYWYESSDLVIRTQMFDPVTLAFQGHGMYMESENDGVVHSPYVKLAGSVGRLNWQAGLKYFYYKDPASQGYISSAPAFELVAAPDLYREEKTYDELLPTVGLSYPLTDTFEVTTSYGRNQIRPYAYMPLVNVYNQNRSVFQGAGITLNDLFSNYIMETSDSFELGARFYGDRFEIMPVVFYARHENLLVTVYDPRVDLSYRQYIGKATGYGVELETNFMFNHYVSGFLNPAFTVLTYDDDLTYQGNVLNTDGRQVVDTPEWSVKAGVILSCRDFEVIPIVRYTGSRFGDAENQEKVDDSIVADVKISYTRRNLAFLDSLKVSLDVSNIFDEKYVSVINASDDTRAGSAGYYVGAPFTTVLSVTLGL